MKIQSMRWGYTGDQMGCGCGMMEGDYIVEVKAYDKNGYMAIVTDAQMSEAETVYVSVRPLFDALMGLDRQEDVGGCIDAIRAMAVEIYDMYPDDEDEVGSTLEIQKLIHLARLAGKACMEAEGEPDKAKRFIQEYIQKEIAEVNLPEYDFCEEEYDENDEDDAI